MALLSPMLRRAWVQSFRFLVRYGALVFVLGAEATSMSAQPVQEHEIKAAMLFNFARFVEWPPHAFENERAPLVIGILGGDPFGPLLDELVRNEVVKDRSVAVRRLQRLEDADRCQILFIGDTEAGRFERILKTLQDRPVLTVGNLEGFARSGGMVRFLTVHGRIRLRVNLAAARGAGLQISSKILRAADIVESDEGK